LALTFLVTGASRGIGRALCEAAIARGDRVIAAVRDVSSVPFPAIVMDVASTESVRAARLQVADPIDVLVNNAGISGGPQRAPGMDLERAERIIQVDELGPLRVYDAFADLLRKGRGILINVSSEAGSLSQFRASGKPEYAMAKAGLNALTRWIGAKDPEVLPISIHPGWTRSATGGDEAPQSPEEAALKLLSAIDRLGPAHRGGFYDTELAEIPW
jgi:NAD(P)-dependent dehydrogenase (short-subunit alcohol dehydrogenase family)